MNIELTTPPEASRAMQIAEQAHELALAIEIDSPEMYKVAGDELRSIAGQRKQIEELRLSLTRPLDESKKRIMDLFRRPTERLENAEGLIRTAMISFHRAEQERAEQARRDAEERARAEREALARQQREAEEAARKAREAADAAAAAGRVDEQAQAAAAQAEAEVERVQVEAELAEVAPVTAVVAAPVKASGISTRQNWKAEVVDFCALVIAAGKAAEAGDTTMLGYVQADTKALGQVAKALKAQARIPGVRVFSDDVLSVRTAA